MCGQGANDAGAEAIVNVPSNKNVNNIADMNIHEDGDHKTAKPETEIRERMISSCECPSGYKPLRAPPPTASRSKMCDSGLL